MGPTRSDADVIAEALRAPTAFGEIFDRHFDAVSRYLRRRVGETAGDELAAETFVIAFRRRADYDLERSSAGPWLFGIATNLARRESRTEKRRLRAIARITPEQEPDHGPEAIRRLDAERAQATLARGLASLTPDQRDVLLLYAWEGLSYAEISEGLDIPVGTVRSRLSHARRAMRELLLASGQLDAVADDAKGIAK